MKKLFTLLVIFTFFVSALSVAQIQKKGEIKNDKKVEKVKQTEKKVVRDDGIKSFVKYPDISGGPLNTNIIAPSIFPNMSPNATITIGSGTATSNYLPINAYYGYSYTQQIYTQAQIATLGQITKIRFYYSSGSTTNSNSWTIYMGHTTKTTFASTTDWVPVGSMSTVFSGTVTFPASAGWMEITLSTPFDYNNSNNLVIAIDENTPSYSANTCYWRSFTSGTNTGIYYYSDGTNPNPSTPPTATSRTAAINQLQLEMTTSTPSLSVSPSSLALGYAPFGSSTVSQSYTLSGTNLSSSPITVTAPTGFEVSLNNSSFAGSQTVTFTPPTLANTPIYVRCTPLASNTNYSGNITNAGGGATTMDVAVTGSSYLYSRYCTSNATTIADEDIFIVTVGSLNNTSTCLTTGGVGSIINQYSNYTTTVSPTDLQQGSTNAFSVGIGTCGGNYSSAI